MKMYSAIIHKKGIRNAFDEDALTSLVFDTLRFLPDDILHAYLATAENMNGSKLSELLLSPFTKPKIHFWKSFKPEGDWKGDGCIPDSIMIWNDLVIVEESKWESPKSGAGIEDADLRDQLVKEFLVAKRLGEDIKNFVVLYITDDLTMPTEDLKESQDAFAELRKDIPIKEFRSRIYWTNWHNLADILSNRHSDLGHDLYEALGVLGISLPFSGFNFKFEPLDRELLNQNYIIFEFHGRQDREAGR